MDSARVKVDCGIGRIKSWCWRVLIGVAVLVLTFGMAGCPDEPEDYYYPPSEDIGRMIDFGFFSIDATEVTRDQYRAFLQSSPQIDPLSEHCSWKETFEPTCDWPEGERGDRPATCVDWCDAQAYCQWAGKELCKGEWEEPEEDMWYLACSNNRRLNYPYGDEFDPFACNGFSMGVEAPSPVGAFTSCEGGKEHLWDMSGNVIEWTGVCSTGAGELGACRIRGGSFANVEDVLRCDYDFGADTYRDLSGPRIGFRCCEY